MDIEKYRLSMSSLSFIYDKITKLLVIAHQYKVFLINLGHAQHTFSYAFQTNYTAFFERHSAWHINY